MSGLPADVLVIDDGSRSSGCSSAATSRGRLTRFAAAVAALRRRSSSRAAGARRRRRRSRSLVGQKIMTGIDGPTPERLAARADPGRRGRRRHPLRPEHRHRRAGRRASIRQLQAAAAAGGNPPLLIAVDQEGGAVKRFPDGPPDVSPRARWRTAAKATPPRGRATGRVPARGSASTSTSRRCSTRRTRPRAGSGPAPSAATRRVNAQLGTAFVAGLQQRRRRGDRQALPGPRHRARDDRHGRRRARPRRSRRSTARLRPFRAAIDGGVDLVMVSNAGYTAYDPTGTPAVLSRADRRGPAPRAARVQGRRDQRRARGPGPSQPPPGTASTASTAAGVDVLLYADEEDSAAAYSQLVAAARIGRAPARGAAARRGPASQALKRQLVLRRCLLTTDSGRAPPWPTGCCS